MTTIIRNMTIDDIAAVENIAVITWHHTYDKIIPLKVQDNFLQMAYSSSTLLQRLQQTIFYVAEVNGQIAGFANYSSLRENNSSELSAIYIHPDFQNQGLGSLFLKQAINQIAGLKEIQLNVEKDNQLGMNFYHAKGFKIMAEFDDDFDGHTLKTVRMMLKLNNKSE